MVNVKPPKYKSIVYCLYCSGCGFKLYIDVVLNKFARYAIRSGVDIPTRVVEKFRKCPKCGKRFEKPKLVSVRWLT